jgi:hypothetical protein
MGRLEIALSKMIGNLVQRALSPLFGFGKPENPAFGIQQGTLTAKEFLTADFNKLVHELHSRVKPISPRNIAKSWRKVLSI